MPEDGVPERTRLVACAQFDVRRADVDHNLGEVERVVRAAAGHGAKLVVLPEMWTTSLCRADEYTDELLLSAADAEDRLLELGEELGLVLVGGGPKRAGGGILNRAVVSDGGRVLGEYAKIHLFSPLGEDKIYRSGSEPLVVDTSAGRIGVAICYDVRFPELTRWYFHRGCEILAVPAQWPEARSTHWRILLKARALENEMFVVGCNRTGHENGLKPGDAPLVFPGDSRIVDPMGEVLAAGEGNDKPLEAELDMRRVRTMRRILPVARDRRPDVYRALWERVWKREDPHPEPPPGSTRA